MNKIQVFLLIAILFASCSGEKRQQKQMIDEDKLGFIEADVKSENTNLRSKAEYGISLPGNSETIERAFENAPPLIPHTTTGFFPIKIKNNICFSCHLPDKAKAVGATPLPETHFTDLRPEMEQKDGVYYTTFEGKLAISKIKNFNNAYFNCSQCHVPQAEVSVNIENLFTPEFRDVLYRKRSGLEKTIKEGIEN